MERREKYARRLWKNDYSLEIFFPSWKQLNHFSSRSVLVQVPWSWWCCLGVKWNSSGHQYRWDNKRSPAAEKWRIWCWLSRIKLRLMPINTFKWEYLWCGKGENDPAIHWEMVSIIHKSIGTATWGSFLRDSTDLHHQLNNWKLKRRSAPERLRCPAEMEIAQMVCKFVGKDAKCRVSFVLKRGEAAHILSAFLDFSFAILETQEPSVGHKKLANKGSTFFPQLIRQADYSWDLKKWSSVPSQVTFTYQIKQQISGTYKWL